MKLQSLRCHRPSNRAAVSHLALRASQSEQVAYDGHDRLFWRHCCKSREEAVLPIANLEILKEVEAFSEEPRGEGRPVQWTGPSARDTFCRL